MDGNHQKGMTVGRRTVLKGGAAIVGAAAALPRGLVAHRAEAASPPHTMAIAAQATAIRHGITRALLLAGAWMQGKPGDLECLSTLTGFPYDDHPEL